MFWKSSQSADWKLQGFLPVKTLFGTEKIRFWPDHFVMNQSIEKKISVLILYHDSNRTITISSSSRVPTIVIDLNESLGPSTNYGSQWHHIIVSICCVVVISQSQMQPILVRQCESCKWVITIYTVFDSRQFEYMEKT